MTDFLYLHGFNSGPGSAKARETQAFLAGHGLAERFHCPQLSPYPGEALQQAQELLDTLPADTVLIGSSLGGFYATWLAERNNKRAVLINPSVYPFQRHDVLTVEQVHPYTGQRYRLTANDLALLKRHFIERPDVTRYWLLLGSQDETLDWKEAARHYAGCRTIVFNGDDHRLARWPECLPGLLRVAAEPAMLSKAASAS
jgi:predicted esterase YcpF (UPF0227 family)